MKKIIAFFICVLLLAGCAPSAEVIQKAIEQTQAAMPTITPTATPSFTSTPTTIPPTATPAFTSPPTTIPPTKTLTGLTYILESGFCLVDIGEITGNPKDVPGCGVQKRTQTYIPFGGEVTITYNDDVSNRQVFCSLYKLDGTYIMTDMDTTGSGEVTCSPN